mmetsp:Transcript_38528/g.78673  ORF Transcript_38528/g.78673 Transcript_38528/m.78673 type:complete len:118 (-) Transcript_38528:732-1085(-)
MDTPLPSAAADAGAISSSSNSDTSNMQRPQFAGSGGSGGGMVGGPDLNQRQHLQQQQLPQQQQIDPDDPLLIAQSLTYVTDDGSVNVSFASAPFSTCEFAWYMTCFVFGQPWKGYRP